MIAPRQGLMRHKEQIAFFNDLIIDLKKQVLGHDPRQPLIMDRLNEATQHVAYLERCRDYVGCCGPRR